jgi:hypothetical protein
VAGGNPLFEMIKLGKIANLRDAGDVEASIKRSLLDLRRNGRNLRQPGISATPGFIIPVRTKKGTRRRYYARDGPGLC